MTSAFYPILQCQFSQSQFSQISHGQVDRLDLNGLLTICTSQKKRLKPWNTRIPWKPANCQANVSANQQTNHPRYSKILDLDLCDAKLDIPSGYDIHSSPWKPWPIYRNRW